MHEIFQLVPGTYKERGKNKQIPLCMFLKKKFRKWVTGIHLFSSHWAHEGLRAPYTL